MDGLTPADLVLYEDNVPQEIRMDRTTYPIDLVVAVQTSANAGAVIDKLGGSGILFSQLLAADKGETAVISFSDDVRIHQDFTSEPDPVIHSLRMLRKEGDSAHILDGIRQALLMLEQRPPSRRRIILMIAEKHDRSSAAKLTDIVEQNERVNATVYWLTFSPFLEPFTVKIEDQRGSEARRRTHQSSKVHTLPGTRRYTGSPDVGPGGYLYALGELLRLRQPDLSTLLTATTGGRSLNFLKKSALEHAIELVSEEVHRQYVLTFEPKGGQPGQFHSVRVEVKQRPELRASTRQGYWALQ